MIGHQDKMRPETAEALQRQYEEPKAEAAEPEQPKEKKFAVVEIFGPTIQGEGPLAGSKTMFIRFGGCDYRCGRCDSLHAVIPSAVKANSRYLTSQQIADELIPKAQATGTKWVVFSGGNPCMWDLTELVHLLHQAGLNVSVETQGTLAPEWLRQTDLIVVSPKAPGMGEKFEPDKLAAFVSVVWGCYVPIALKVVVFSAQDIEWALHMQSIAKVPAGMLYMSLGNDRPPPLNPDNTLDTTQNHADHVMHLLSCYRMTIEELLTDPRITDWKFLPQLHVLVWGNEAEK